MKACLLVVVVLLCVGVPIVNAEGVSSNWTSPTTESLSGVYMIDTNNGWAVGAAGTIIRWDGTDWTLYTTTTPTTENLYDVFMVDTNDGWAVGAGGTIIRWTGAEWIPEFPPAILTALLIGLTLVAVILAKTMSKKPRKPSMPGKTQL